MKFLSIFVLFISMSLIIACGNKAETTTETASDTPALTTETSGQQAAAPAGGSGAHYQCPSGHPEGNSNDKGTCPKCGAELAHNAAFHGAQPANGQTPQNAIQVDPSSVQGGGLQTGTPTAATPTPPPPAQNAAGEYHHICPKGCAGGAGSPGNCAKCGTALAHNDKYHAK